MPYHPAPPILPLFVYGTLRPGESNYVRLLAGRTLLEKAAVISGSLYYVPEEDYPYLLAGSERVQGDLLILAEESYAATLQAVDRLEDYDPLRESTSLYLRRTHPVNCDGEEILAWVYFWNSLEMPGRLLAEGDFRLRPGARDAIR